MTTHTDITRQVNASGKIKRDSFTEEELARIENLKQAKLKELIKSDPSAAYYRESMEREHVYNYGSLSGVATDSAEILHHKQVLTMKHKMSFMTYRIKRMWPLFDTLAAYQSLVLYTVILAFALYY